MEARRLRNKMEKGRGSVRLKFWQKTYLLTLALFLLALGGGITAIASVSQQRAFEAECGKLLAQQHSVPFPVSWTVKMKKKQKETQDILSYHTQAAGCSDKARAKASGGRQPIEECGRTGL